MPHYPGENTSRAELTHRVPFSNINRTYTLNSVPQPWLTTQTMITDPQRSYLRHSILNTNSICRSQGHAMPLPPHLKSQQNLTVLLCKYQVGQDAIKTSYKSVLLMAKKTTQFVVTCWHAADNEGRLHCFVPRLDGKLCEGGYRYVEIRA
jgi:hypothetical protein